MGKTVQCLMVRNVPNAGIQTGIAYLNEKDAIVNKIVNCSGGEWIVKEVQEVMETWLDSNTYFFQK